MELVPEDELESFMQSRSNLSADQRAKKERKERHGRSTRASALSTPIERGEEDNFSTPMVEICGTRIGQKRERMLTWKILPKMKLSVQRMNHIISRRILKFGGLCISGMSVIWIILSWLLSFGGVSIGLNANVTSRPKNVSVGVIFTLDSTIGKVAKFAIEEVVKDVNANSSVLSGTTLTVDIRNSNCSGFLGLIEALRFMETDCAAVIGPQSSVVAHTILHVANELQTHLFFSYVSYCQRF